MAAILRLVTGGRKKEQKYHRTEQQAEAGDDEEAPVDHTQSGRFDDAPKETVYVEKPGIPMPPIPRFRLILCIRWLLLTTIVLGLLHTLGRVMTEQMVYEIESVTEIVLDVDNCDVEMLPLPANLPKSVVTVQYWKFMNQIHGVDRKDLSHGGEELTVNLDMRVKIPMFRCLVTIFSPKGKLDRLSGHVGGSEHCRMVMAEALANEVNLTSQQVSVQVASLPKKLALHSSHGMVAFHPKAPTEDWEVHLKADSVNVFAQIPSDISVKLHGEAETNSVLCGDAASKTSSGYDLTYSDSSAGTKGVFTLDVVNEAAGYLQAGRDAAAPGLEVVRGSSQKQPQIFGHSVEQLEDLADWMKQRAQGAAPWVARVHVNGPDLPRGSWEILSSEAFLTVPLQWYVLLSAGTLRPIVKEVHIHPMGLGAWPLPPKELHGAHNRTKRRLDPILDKEFQLLLPFFQKAEAPSATVAWVPHVGRPLVLTKATNGWAASALSYTQVNVLMFLIAVAFNVVVAFTVSAGFLMWLQNNAEAQEELRDEAVTTASSHRVGKLSGKTNTSWRVIATHVEQPDQGVILRWRKRTGVQQSVYLCVKAKADPDPSRGLEGDEICIDMANQERIDMKSESNIIVEFFFSASGSKGYPATGGYEPTGKDLKCQYNYRFQIEGYNHNQEHVATSDWSNEVYIKPRSTVFDLPLRILKSNFAVPTNSLEYFVEHFAEFNISGKHPQQLVILSKIKVCYHKNWNDFRDCKSDFCLTAHMGESSVKCEKDTRSGTCRNFDKTGIFQPLNVGMDIDDDEDARTQELDEAIIGPNQSLELGAADRRLTDVYITLRKSSGEDVAEGKLDWWDLVEAFEQSEEQQIFVELVTDKVEGEFDEDWLIWVEAEVTFRNELDPECEQMPFRDRFFQSDPPGEIYYEGMERFVAWDPTSESLAEIKDFDIFLTYPDDDLDPVLLVEKAQVSNGGASIMITFPAGISANYVVCQMGVEAFNHDGEVTYARSTLDEQMPMKSHRFIICRTWNLAEFELMYASFCRMNNMEMERVTEDALASYGMVVAREQLKVVHNLRRNLVFEEVLEDDRVLDCPGLIMISEKNIIAKHPSVASGEPIVMGSDAGGSLIHTISSGKSPLLGGSSGAGGGRSGARAGPIVIKPREYRATFQTVGFLENAWPRYPSIFDVAYGTGWMPSFLLLNSFYPVDNIINAFAQGAEALQLQVAYQTVQVLGGRRVADNLLACLQAPLYGLVPYCCEGFLYLLQMASFLLLPFLLLVFGLCYELVGMFFASNPEEYDVALRSKSHIPDITFSGVVSGHTLEDWMEGLSSVSFVALVGSTATSVLVLLLICESNFLRNLPPFDFQHAVHRLINAVGNIIVTTYLWAILSFMISSVLWFAMVVVIYPEQMLTALACAGGLAAVFATMISGLKTTKDELERSLREEIPEVLELACDTFLDQYDKTSSGRSKAVSAQFRKLEESLAENSCKYVRERLTQNREVQDIISVSKKKPPKEVLGCLFNRALVKAKNWASITASENGEGNAIETTENVLESLGLPQEDTSVMPYLDLRMRLEDKEREEGGENIHNYGSDLQEKLMKVFVRMQERHMEVAPDVDDALRNPKKLAICMSRANAAKFKALERISEGKDARSSLQICIQDLNQQQVDKVYLRMVEHLDESLSQVDISEKVTPFVETTLPAEIDKQVRFVLDEQRPHSSAQKLFDTIRRKKNSIKRTEVRQRLTLKRADVSDGLIAFLEDVGLLDKSAQKKKAMHYTAFYNRVERGVHSWRREDDDGMESKDLVVDPADVEDFVRELVHGQIWWGAMEKILKNIGFPLASERNKSETNVLSREQVMYQFEMAAAKDGMLPKDKFLDFLRKISCADVADGAAGRIWKAQMVMLLQHLNICGFVGKVLDKEKDADETDDGLREMSVQRWPNWLEQAWEKVAPKLSEHSESRPFLPRTLIYKFIKSVAFSAEEKSRVMSEDWKAMKVVDEEYDTWKLQKDAGDSRSYLWVNRGKSLQRLRGIWNEVFLDILSKMGSPVQDTKQGLLLFQEALREQRKVTSSSGSEEFEGLLSVDFLVNHWMQKKLVENTDEVSLQIFKDALEKAEFTLPPSSVEALWYAADKTKCTHPSLRQVKDLEDRLVMYMSSGMFFESVRTLISNELQVPTLHGLDAKEIKAAFKQVDEKTGCCGIIDPHEVCELLLLLSQEGMDLQTVQASFQQLHMNLDADDIQDAFMIVDTNCDDKIDLTEFLSLIDKLVDQVIPEAIFEYMGLLRHQILSNVLIKVTTILTMFLFVFVSLNAFHVNVGQKATTAGSSMIRAALAGLALLGLRNDNSPEYMEKQYNIAREQLYRITGVSRSQLEARRRTGSLGAGAANMSFSKGRFAARRGGGGGGMLGKEDEEEDDGGGDL